MNIIITGASKGLGKAFAQAFAANNTLLLCARNIEDLEATKTEIEQENINTLVYAKQTDVSKKNEVVDFANWCLGFGTPNIVINNAGQFIPGNICNEDENVLEHLMQTNLYSVYHLTRQLLPAMMAAQQGHIFNICSIASLQAYTQGGSYSISKFALLGFSKNLRQELMPHNIKVTSVMPGAVYTNSWAGSGINPQRIMQDVDIAKMVYATSQLSMQACVEEIVIRPQLGDL